MRQRTNPDSANEEKAVLPSVARARTVVEHYGKLKQISQFKKTLNSKLARFSTLIFSTSAYCTYYYGQRIWNEFNKVFCEDLIKGAVLPEEGCWRNKSRHGVTWDQWAFFCMAAATFSVTAYHYWFRKPIFVTPFVSITDVVTPNELQGIMIVNDSIRPNMTPREVLQKADQYHERIKAIFKDRPAALTFFKSAHQIKKGTVFVSGVNIKIAEFLGCPDLPEKAEQLSIRKRN